jgi:hypothetical protein
MSVTRDVLQSLARLESGQSVLDSHLHIIMKGIAAMSAALDRLTAAVDANGASTDALSDEVKVAVDYIKSHPAAGNDPELLALAARLEEKNAKAVADKDALTASMAVVSASGGTP